MTTEESRTDKTNIKDKSVNTVTQKRKYVPPDGGWGWVVCLGSFLISIFQGSLPTVFGILFSDFLLHLNTSSTITSWIFNVNMFLWHLAGLATGPLCDKFGWRRVCVVGCFLSSFSIFLSAFAQSASFIFFTFGILAGIGGGTGTTVSVLTLPCYFEKRRGLATSCLVTGVSAGQFIIPVMLRYILEEEGFFGACIIHGAIMLNSCVAGLLFHPVEWHAKLEKIPEEARSLQTIKQNLKTDLRKQSLQNINSVHYTDQNSLCLAQDLKDEISKTDNDKNLAESNIFRPETQMIETKESKLNANLRKPSLQNINSVNYISQSSLCLAQDLKDEKTAESGYENSGGPDNPKHSSIIKRTMLTVVKSLWNYLKILRQFRALIVSLGMTFFVTGFSNFLMVIPFVLNHKGFSLEQSAWCMSVASFVNMVFRMLTSMISDHPKFNKILCYRMGSLLSSIAIIVFPLLNTYSYILITTAIWGCGVGLNMGLYSLVMIEVMGLDKFSKLLGATCFLIAFVFVAIGPLLGFLRDISHSYTITCWVMAGLSGATFFLYFFLPMATKADLNRIRINKEVVNIIEKS